CTMTRPPRSVGSTSSRWSTTGTATLYGRLATSTSGASSRSSGRSRSASAVMTASRSAALGMRSATVCGSCRASTGSISTAITLRTRSSRARVSEPRPGPTSITTSPGSSSAVRTMRRTVPPSITKFWPSRFLGRRASLSARPRMSAGPSRLTASRPPSLRTAPPKCLAPGGALGPSARYGGPGRTRDRAGGHGGDGAITGEAAARRSLEEPGPAVRPLPLPAALHLLVEELGPVGLLLGGPVHRGLAAADRAPHLQADRVHAEVGARRVDRARVAAGLALRESVPVEPRDLRPDPLGARRGPREDMDDLPVLGEGGQLGPDPLTLTDGDAVALQRLADRAGGGCHADAPPVPDHLDLADRRDVEPEAGDGDLPHHRRRQLDAGGVEVELLEGVADVERRHRADRGAAVLDQGELAGMPYLDAPLVGEGLGGLRRDVVGGTDLHVGPLQRLGHGAGEGVYLDRLAVHHEVDLLGDAEHDEQAEG